MEVKLINSINIFLSENINFYEKNFLEAVILTMLSIFSLYIFPQLQYKYKLLSRMTNNDMGRAADFLAYFLIHIGTFKNYAFFEALFTNKRIDVNDWYYYSIFPIGVLLIVVGVTLVIFSFHRLGLRGMYFGDHFGFLFNKKIDQFPYNYLENPQYVGTNLVYVGLSFTFRSVAGMFLSLFMIVMYRIFWLFIEKKKLKKFYPKYSKRLKDDSDDSTNSDASKKKK
jgi:phosphatidylethanolamine N-methyltransferase